MMYFDKIIFPEAFDLQELDPDQRSLAQCAYDLNAIRFPVVQFHADIHIFRPKLSCEETNFFGSGKTLSTLQQDEIYQKLKRIYIQFPKHSEYRIYLQKLFFCEVF